MIGWYDQSLHAAPLSFSLFFFGYGLGGLSSDLISSDFTGRYSGRSGLRRARARRSLGAEEVDKAARGRTPVYGGASGSLPFHTAPAGAEPTPAGPEARLP